MSLQGLQGTLDEQDKPPRLILSGRIDEHVQFGKLPYPQKGSLTIDLDQVTYINSIGLRNWVQWVVKLKELSQIFFRHIRPLLVSQMNVLEGFLPFGAIVESFYVPYYCDECGHEFDVIMKRGKEYKEADSTTPERIEIPTSCKCPECSAQADADIIEAKYYKFLKTTED